MSDGLVEFVRQCLARDEQAARAAAAGSSAQWQEGSSWLADLRNPTPSQRAVLRPGADLISDADAVHIARHDPARVLAEVEAKRTILDRHEPGVSEPSECGRCNDPWPCDDVKALAQPYAGEPGWREAWRL